MLDVIRQYRDSWQPKVILGAIAVVFIFWGFGSQYDTTGGANFAAKVNGDEISIDQFEQQYRNESSRRRQAQSNFSEAFLMKQVLDGLIETKLLEQFAEEAGIHVSPEEVADEIKKLPFLTDEETGSFIGKQKYVEFLRERDIDVAEFEKDVEQSLRVQKAREFVESSVKVTPDEVREEFDARNEKVSLSYLRVDAAALAESLKSEKVTQAQIAAWVAANSGKVESIYAERKESTYTTPAKVDLLQITVRKPAGAQKDESELASAKRRSERALEQAATDWKAAAAQYSEGAPWEKTGEPRSFARRELPAAVAERVFLMSPEEAPAVVETPTSFTVVKVKSITPEKVTELDEALKNAIVEEEIRAERAKTAVEAFATDATARLERGGTLEQLAKTRKLTVKETGSFPRKDEIPGIAESDRAMVSAAFALEKPGAVLLLGGKLPKVGDGYLIAVLKEHQRPTDDEYEKQKGWIESSLKRTRGMEAFRSWKADRVAKAKIVENPRYLSPSS